MKRTLIYTFVIKLKLYISCTITCVTNHENNQQKARDQSVPVIYSPTIELQRLAVTVCLLEFEFGLLIFLSMTAFSFVSAENFQRSLIKVSCSSKYKLRNESVKYHEE